MSRRLSGILHSSLFDSFCCGGAWCAGSARNAMRYSNPRPAGETARLPPGNATLAAGSDHSRSGDRNRSGSDGLKFELRLGNRRLAIALLHCTSLQVRLNGIDRRLSCTCKSREATAGKSAPLPACAFVGTSRHSQPPALVFRDALVDHEDHVEMSHQRLLGRA